MNDIRQTSAVRYRVRHGRTPGSLNAGLWSGVGRTATWKGSAPGRLGATVLQVMVARSSTRAENRSPAHRLPAGPARALIDTLAGATTDGRREALGNADP